MSNATRDTVVEIELRRIGVIGMGAMGSPMACSLLRAQYQVGVFNRTADMCGFAQTNGAWMASSAADLAANSDALILMLSDDVAVESVITGNYGVLAGGQAGLIVINCSTVLPRTNQRFVEPFAERGLTLLDAPVTGSRPQAETGQLYFLVGGDGAAYRRCIPLFEAMGRGHIHLGPLGSGACAKLANNLMGFVNLAGLVEALELVTRFGLAPEEFMTALSNSGGRSEFSRVKGPKILSSNWSPDFALKLAAKDLRLAKSLADEMNQFSPVLTQTATTFALAANTFGNDDVCSVVRWYRQYQEQPRELHQASGY